MVPAHLYTQCSATQSTLFLPISHVLCGYSVVIFPLTVEDLAKTGVCEHAASLALCGGLQCAVHVAV